MGGRGRIGADGLAFWYTAAKSTESPATGHVYGSVDRWIGLGLFFDSFDNDNKHNNPYIMAMTNDGTKNFDHQNDGSTQQLAGCLRDFRNKPFPVRAKIEYFKNTLTVLFHNGMSNNDKDFEMCIRAENVVLPKNGYFGVSAATGGLADDHDVLKLVTHSLRSPDMALTPDHVDQEESRKFETEFEEFQQKNAQQKEEWIKANPEKAKAMRQAEGEDWGDDWEDDSIRELKQIFQGQSAMNDVLRELHRKMDEIIGRQERSLSVLTAIQNTGAGGRGPAAPAVGGGQPPIDTIRRDEVTAVQSAQGRGTATVQQIGGGGDSALLGEIRDSLNHVKRDIKNFVTDVHSKVTALFWRR